MNKEVIRQELVKHLNQFNTYEEVKDAVGKAELELVSMLMDVASRRYGDLGANYYSNKYTQPKQEEKCECREENPDECIFGNMPCDKCIGSECCGVIKKKKEEAEAKAKAKAEEKAKKTVKEEKEDEDIFSLLRRVYSAEPTKKEEKKVEEKKETTPTVSSSKYSYSCNYDPSDDTYIIEINDNGKKTRQKVNAKGVAVKSEQDKLEEQRKAEMKKIEELKKKISNSWDLGDLCSYFK